MGRTRSGPTKRQAEILASAFALFQEQGYQNVSMEKIAGKCGIARTTLYEYFPNKEQLLLTLAEGIADEVHSVDLKGNNCFERLISLATHFLEKVQSNRAIYKILFQEAPVLSGDVSQKLLKWRTEQFEQVVLIAQEGKSMGELRSDIGKTDAGFMFQAVVGQRAGELLWTNQKVQPQVEAERLVRLLWYGIGK